MEKKSIHICPQMLEKYRFNSINGIINAIDLSLEDM